MSAEIDVVFALIAVVVFLLFRSNGVLDILQFSHEFDFSFVFEAREVAHFDLADFLDDFWPASDEVVDFREVVAHGDVDNFEFRNVLGTLFAVVFFDLLFDFLLDFLVDDGVFRVVGNAGNPHSVVAGWDKQFIAEFVEHALVGAEILENEHDGDHREQVHDVLEENEILVAALVRKRKQSGPRELANVGHVVPLRNHFLNRRVVLAILAHERVRKDVVRTTRHEDQEENDHAALHEVEVHRIPLA